jgi:glutaredoxin
MYTQDGCPTCERAKSYYDNQKIVYEERNINRDEKWLEEAEALSPSRTVPITITDGKIEHGFQGRLG